VMWLACLWPLPIVSTLKLAMMYISFMTDVT
jgi:hypothetical protein